MATYPIPAGFVVLTSPTRRHPDTGALVAAVVANPQPEEIAQIDGVWPFIRTAAGTERQFRPPADPEPRPLRMLTPNQVIDLILVTVGAAAFAEMVRSEIDEMVTWRFKMSVARDISKAQAAAGLQIIAEAGLMTANQRTAILENWPS